MTIPGIYSQRDPQWSGLELGFNTDPNFNMYHYGCLVTAIANLLWYNGNPGANPGAVNSWLKDNSGFAGGLVIWGALQPLLDQVQVVSHGYSSNLDEVNAFLADENAYAILQLTKPGFPMHFSIAPYVGQIADSWDGTLKPMDSYTFVGAHLYSKVVAPVVSAVVVPPVVTPPPVAPAIAAPTPEPVPSTSAPIPEPVAEPVVTVTPDPTMPPEPAPVETPVPAAPAAEPIPAESTPEVKTESVYEPFDRPTQVFAPHGSGVIDMVNDKAVSKFPAGRPLTVVGFVTYKGERYLQTQNLVDNLPTHGLPVSDFELYHAPANPLDGITAPVPVSTTPKPTLEETLSKTSNWFVRLLLRFVHHTK